LKKEEIIKNEPGNLQDLIAIREYVNSLKDDSFVCASISSSIIGRGFDIE